MWLKNLRGNELRSELRIARTGLFKTVFCSRQGIGCVFIQTSLVLFELFLLVHDVLKLEEVFFGGGDTIDYNELGNAVAGAVINALLVADIKVEIDKRSFGRLVSELI